MLRSGTAESSDVRTPLLVRETQVSRDRSSHNEESRGDNGEPPQDHSAQPTGGHRTLQVKLLYTIYVLVVISTSFITPAMNKAEEAALLYRYRPRSFGALESEIPREVQDELRRLRGMQGILGSVVGGITALFFSALRSGWLHSRVSEHLAFINGAKEILVAALIGIFISRVSMGLFCRFRFNSSFNVVVAKIFSDIVHLL